MADKNILQGPDPLFEPAKGGLGYELFRTLKLNKGKLAQNIIATGEKSTYDDLLEKSIKIAIYLSRQDLCREDVACVFTENSSNSIIPLIVTQFVGLKYIAIDPTIPERDIVRILEYLEVKLIFVSELFEKKIDACTIKSSFKGKIIVMGKSKKFKDFPQLLDICEGIETFRPVYIDDIKEDAVIFLSSGTTGNPKAIRISHYALLGQIFNRFSRFGRGTIRFSNYTFKSINPKKYNFMLYSPSHWISSITIILSMFLSGGSITLGTRFGAKEAWSALRKYGANVLFLPPGQANELCANAEGEEAVTTLEAFWTGGALVSRKTVENMRKCFPEAVIAQFYGQTENIGIITGYNMNRPDELALIKKYPLSCGRVCYGIQVKIVNPDNEEICGERMTGEVRLKNKFLMSGYYKIDSSVAFDSDGWLKTGDLGYFDDNGSLFIQDRLKDLLLYRRYDIHPSVIEELLLEHPAVHDSVVIGYPHPFDNDHPMGIVILKKEHEHGVSADELIEFVNNKVEFDAYKIRAGIKFVDKFLTTSSGKPKKFEMKKLIISGLM